MADNTIKIGGELESMATGKIVAAASAIKDKSRNKTQEVINGDVEAAIAEQSAQFEALSEETSEAVAFASESARQAEQYLADLQEAIQDLPDGQAVSAEVAVHTTSIERLEEEVSGLSSDVEGGTIDHSDTEIHAYLDNSGSPVSQNASDCTDFIPVSEGDTFMYGGITGEALSPVYGYSNNSGSNPQVLVRHTGNTYKETEFAIPSGVNYIKAWSRNSSHSSTPSSLKLIDITRAVGLKQRVESLESKFSNLENNVNGGQGIDYSDTDIHAYINNSGQLVSSNTSDCTDYIAVEEGETFKYGGVTGEALSPVYGYSDTSGNGYQALVSPTGDTYKEKDFTVPSGVNYIKAWSRNSSHSSTPSSLKLIDITRAVGLKQRVESLESAIVDVEGEIIDYSETNIHAYLNNGEAVSSNTSDCTDYIAVEEGETFKYGGVTGEALSPVYGYSNNSGGNPQALVNPTGNTYKETEITIPNSVSYIRAWSRNGRHTTTPSALKMIKIIHKGVDEKLNELNYRVSELEEGQTASVNVPQSFNGYPLPYRPQTLKILSVGNSFIQYPLLALTSYLSALGITNVIYGCIAKGACTLAMFKQNLANNTKDLSFQLSVNGNAFKYYDAETGEDVQGSGDAIYCSCLKDAFAYDKWDIITFQQESSNSGKWNTIEPNIGDIIQGARYYCPNAGVKIAWHQTWAYANGFTERLVNYGGSQEKMFNAIVEVSKSIVTKFDVDLIIPSGVILQSIRGISNSFWGADKDTIKGADTYSAGNPQSDFTIDGYHPNPYAVYALCGGLVQLLINSCLGKTIRGCTATYQTAVGDYAKVARQAALKCIGSRYSIVAIDTTNLE